MKNQTLGKSKAVFKFKNSSAISNFDDTTYTISTIPCMTVPTYSKSCPTVCPTGLKQ